MTIIVRGRDKSEVLNRLNDIIGSFEKQQKFDHKTEVRKTDDGWEGTIEIFWHTESYPSHYEKPDLLPRLPGGERNAAVDRIYFDKNIKRR